MAKNTSMIPSQVHVPHQQKFLGEHAANQEMRSTAKPLNYKSGSENLTEVPQETNDRSGHFMHYSKTNGRG